MPCKTRRLFSEWPVQFHYALNAKLRTNMHVLAHVAPVDMKCFLPALPALCQQSHPSLLGNLPSVTDNLSASFCYCTRYQTVGRDAVLAQDFPRLSQPFQTDEPRQRFSA